MIVSSRLIKYLKDRFKLLLAVALLLYPFAKTLPQEEGKRMQWNLFNSTNEAELSTVNIFQIDFDTSTNGNISGDSRFIDTYRNNNFQAIKINNDKWSSFSDHNNLIINTDTLRIGENEIKVKYQNVALEKASEASTFYVYMNDLPLQKRKYFIPILIIILILITLFALMAFRSEQKLKLLVEKKTAQLSKTAREYQNLFDNTNDAIIIFDPSTEIILKANNKACEMYGFEMSEFVGMSLKKITKDIEECEKQIKQIFQTGYLKNFETKHLTKNNRTIDLLVNAAVIDYKGIKAILSNLREITELKEARIAFEEHLKFEKVISAISTDFINTKAENIDDKINSALACVGKAAGVDRSYLFLLFEDNLHFESTHGWHNEDIEPHNLKRISKSTIQWWMEQLKQFKTIHIPRVENLPAEAAAEKEILLAQNIKSLVVVPLINAEKLVGFLEFDSVVKEKTWREEDILLLKLLGQIFANAIDIVELEKKLIQAKEKTEQSDKLKSEFLTLISHEIRTPIFVIIGNIAVIKELFENTINDENRDLFESIELSTKRITRTIDLILNMSELRAGSYKPSFRKIDISAGILKKLVSEHKQLAANKNLELLYKCEAENTEVIADEYSITQIFANLIDNGLKYTKKGKVEVFVYNKENRELITEVKDTGIGMSEEFLARLFEPFVQEKQDYSRPYEGNGLGLALVKKYLDLNNAKIEVESKKGIGTTFRVTLKIT